MAVLSTSLTCRAMLSLYDWMKEVMQDSGFNEDV